MNKRINKVTWSEISFLGKSKFIKSFSVWIIIVPILAKALHNANNIKLFYIEFNLTLPFNLEIFYLCSLTFGLANILYLKYCPDIIKKYENPQDFLNKGGNIYILKQYQEIASNLKGEEVLNIFIKLDDKKYYNRDICGYFSEIEKYFDSKYSKIRKLITLLYAFGILLVVYILIENIIVIFC